MRLDGDEMATDADDGDAGLYCSEIAPGSEADPRSNPDLGRVSPIGKTTS